MKMETKQTNSQEPTTWKERVADQWWKLKLADFGVQIDKDMRRHAMVERLVKKTQDGTLQQVTAEPMDKTLDEQMGVRIGDEIHYHNTQATKPVKSEQQTQGSSLGKTLAAAGLAAAGLGAGVALPIAAWNMTRPDTQVVVEQNPGIDTDTDTQYGLKIYRDD